MIQNTSWMALIFYSFVAAMWSEYNDDHLLAVWHAAWFVFAVAVLFPSKFSQTVKAMA